MAKLPDGFTNLSTLQKRPKKTTGYNVIGMVCDMMPPQASKGGDMMCTFRLVDFSFDRNQSESYGFEVKFFSSPPRPDLPRFNKLGDIIVIRNARVDEWGGRSFIMNNKGVTQWSVYHTDSMPKKEYMLTYMGGKQKLPSTNSRNSIVKTDLMLTQQYYIIELANSYDKFSHTFTQNANVQQPSVQAPAPVIPAKRPAVWPELNANRRKLMKASESKKFRLISEVESNSYADLCVEVVKKWPGQFGCELYVTDYTENKLLYYFPDPLDATGDTGRDGDPFSYTGTKTAWPGPWGHRVLKVVCKNPHSDFANAKVEVGQHIRLTNTKISFNNTNVLEGALWQDQKFPEKICITVLRNGDLPEVQDVIQRKQQYHAARNPMEHIEQAAEETAAEKLSRNGNRKKRRKGKKQQEEDEARAAELRIQEEALKPNQHLRCSNAAVALSSVQTILDASGEQHRHCLPDGRAYSLPFVNSNFRAKVRVVNFLPDKLEDFAVVTDEPYDSSMDLSIESSQKWQWSFALLVQDATKIDTNEDDRVIVNVGHQQAQFLLGNDMPDPANLREQPMLLNKLREKMCVLWGDLEEQKTAQATELSPSNRPFECCIAEYGTLKHGGRSENIVDWERQWMLHGVTII